MINISLNKNFVAIVDDDYAHLADNKWTVYESSKTSYATRINYLGDNKKEKLYLHRVIMNAPKGVIVDHINGDGLDNRKENLRFATKSENLCNRSRTNGRIYDLPKGVTMDKRKKVKKYIVQVCFGGKCQYRAYFETVGEAEEAYIEKSAKIQKDFSYHTSRNTSPK